ncbi:MAG: ABC transporter substrate-binding protein [Spirochaetales bacterium]|nr:ABC transporter substrate-binding protein [Spirochaetales bacterium]
MKILLLGCFVLLFCSCMNNQPVKLGYIGVLTGKYSDLGISGRNGASIAIEEINKSGGINGRKLDLIVKDNKLDPAQCITGAEELLEEGVIAIIGPMTSDMSIALLDLLNRKKVPMISPTASTPRLTGLDDYFLRVNPPDVTEAYSAANFFYTIKRITNVAVVYDLVNKSFTEGLYIAFKETFEKLGHVSIVPIPFSVEDNPDYSRICDSIIESKTDALFIIANSIDSALICQQLKKRNIDILRFLTGWAMTEEFINQAGNAANDVIFNHYHDTESTKPLYIKFLSNYQNKYGKKPDFIASLGYNAAYVIIQTLKKNSHPKDVKQAILDIGTFEGLQGTIQFDTYGDCSLERFYLTIKNNKITSYKDE